ncbi:hypothetical protein WCLP8_250019 [uncultured Gammaproteobacteria bacterium]
MLWDDMTEMPPTKLVERLAIMRLPQATAV